MVGHVSALVRLWALCCQPGLDAGFRRQESKLYLIKRDRWSRFFSSYFLKPAVMALYVFLPHDPVMLNSVFEIMLLKANEENHPPKSVAMMLPLPTSFTMKSPASTALKLVPMFSKA